MIEPNELRIGNYVQVIKKGGWNNIGDLIKVDSISSKGINAWTDHGASGQNNFDGIAPIELTEDKLLRLGFEILGGQVHKTYIHTEKRIKVFVNEAGELHLNIDENYWGEIKSVHKLQNFYYGLIGLELNAAEL